jgi:hypothetical protein
MRSGALSSHRMSANQVGAKTAELLDDPGMNRYSPETILAGLNDAIAEWCIETGCVIDAVDIEFVADQRDYDVKAAIDAGGTLELGVIERIGIYNGTSQDWPYEFLSGKGLAELDRRGLSSYGDGPASAWYNDLVDFNEVSFIPVPDDDYDAGPPKDYGAYVLYSAIPALMTYSAPNFGNLSSKLPTLALLPICYGAAGMILEDGQGEELVLAQERLTIFYEAIDKAKNQAASALTDYGDMEPI